MCRFVLTGPECSGNNPVCDFGWRQDLEKAFVHNIALNLHRQIMQTPTHVFGECDLEGSGFHGCVCFARLMFRFLWGKCFVALW